MKADLHAVAAACMSLVPSYQCLSPSPSAFDDKVLAVAREPSAGRAVGFVSAVLLTAPDLPVIVHAGLTCVAPSAQHTGLVNALMLCLSQRLVRELPSGFWTTSISRSLSSLASASSHLSFVFPSPDGPIAPSPMHLRIADAVSREHRLALAISPAAVFDPTRFVFCDSCPVGSPFRYALEETAITSTKNDHNDRDGVQHVREFYRALLCDGGDGDDILQVGFLDPAVFGASLQKRIRSRTAAQQEAVAV